MSQPQRPHLSEPPKSRRSVFLRPEDQTTLHHLMQEFAMGASAVVRHALAQLNKTATPDRSISNRPQ